MKIAWYTPYSEESAIGRFSEDVVAALVAAEHDVCIVRSEYEGKSAQLGCRGSRASQVVWAEDVDPSVREFLAGFDLVFYNVGDNYSNHAWVIPHQRACPGITILHDYFLHNLLAGWAALSTDPLRTTYDAALRSECGAGALLHYQEEVNQGRSLEWFQGTAHAYSVLAFAVRHTLGIVTHARFYARACEEQCGVPVVTIPLSYRGLLAGERSPDAGKRLRTVITVGNANPNKCYRHVILALGQCPERSKAWVYRIIGRISDGFRDELTRLARSTPHPVTLVFTGQVGDVSLRQEYAAADAVVCLRSPVLEGASASVIESLQNGLPTIVSRAGCYAEIPDSYVFKVEPGREGRDLARYFQVMSSDYGAAEEMGRRAAEWARGHFHPEGYVSKLMEFSGVVVRERPVLELLERLACNVRSFSKEMPEAFREKVAGKLEDLFPSSSLRHERTVDSSPLRFGSRLKALVAERSEEGFGLSAYYCRKTKRSDREEVQVTALGCHGPELLKRQTGFWTKGAATLEVFFKRARVVRWAWVQILDRGPVRQPITFKIDGRVVAVVKRKRCRWVRMRVPGAGPVKRMSVSVEAPSFVPSMVVAGSDDARELGVAIGGIFFAKYWWRFSPLWERMHSRLSGLARRSRNSGRT